MQESLVSGAVTDMGKVTEADVDKLARLAHLNVTEAERRELTRQLDRILAFAERIRAPGTDAVQATAHLGGRCEALRDDRVLECLPREEVLGNAPDEEDGLIKVPRVIR
jgi:aspartyl-tRNA(Asn)/glutamyl-tRNA(Gln) amidotransferase subunit C